MCSSYPVVLGYVVLLDYYSLQEVLGSFEEVFFDPTGTTTITFWEIFMNLFFSYGFFLIHAKKKKKNMFKHKLYIYLSKNI